MIYNISLIALGGAGGSVLRYLCQRALNSSFPYGTFIVNIAGCLLIGLLWGIFSKHSDEQKRLLLVTGFCGGFTTFSSFTYEGIVLLSENRWLTMALYTGASVVVGLLATYLGFKIANS